jgi:hypothetical protein
LPKTLVHFSNGRLDVTIVDLCSCRLAEYFEKRFRRQHGRRLDIDRTGVVGKSGDGELVLWKRMSARANVRSAVRIAPIELPLRVNLVDSVMSAVCPVSG